MTVVELDIADAACIHECKLHCPKKESLTSLKEREDAKKKEDAAKEVRIEEGSKKRESLLQRFFLFNS